MKLLLFLLFPFSLFGVTITGVGIGSTPTQAKQEAILDIVTNIGGDFLASFEKVQQVENGQVVQDNKKKVSKFQYNYPILNPIFSKPKFIDDKYQVTAKIDTKHSKHLYIKKLKQLKKSIIHYQNEAKKSRDNVTKIFLLKKVFELQKEFDRYFSVAKVLKIGHLPSPPTSISVVENKIAEINFQPKHWEKFSWVKIRLNPDRKILKVGENYQILVKFSKPCYFYTIDHIITTTGISKSYLIEWNDHLEGVEKFIIRVPNSMINKWILLGNFQVSEPVGDEYIEVVASQRPITSLPKYMKIKQDGETQYILDGRVYQNIDKLIEYRQLTPIDEVVGKIHFQSRK